MINGSPTDNNAGLFKKGAHSVIDTSGYTVAAEYDTPDWSPDKAQEWMEGQLTHVKAGLDGRLRRQRRHRRRRHRRAEGRRRQARCRRSPARTPSSPRSSASSPATST